MYFLKEQDFILPELREPNDTIYMAYQNVTNLEKYANHIKNQIFYIQKEVS